MKKILYILLLIAFSLSGFSQQFTATVNRNQVGVGEHFKITFTLNTKGDKFVPPAFKGFRVLSGPNQSQSMQYVNGQMSSSISISYILQPQQVGNFEIGAAQIKSGDKVLKSNPVSVKVGKAKQQNAQKNGAKQISNQIKDNVYIKLFVNKKNTFVGEQIIATYKIYTRLDIVDNSLEEMPSFNGFYSQEIDNKQANLVPEIVNGVRFNTAIIKQMVLSPQRSGKLTIDPLAMNLVIRIRDNRSQRSVFDQFFGAYRDVQYQAVSNKVTLNVKAIPNGAPSTFNGAVGSFKLKSSLDKQTVKTNEAINLKISITGNGNIKLIKDPNIEFPPDFEVYDPKENTNIKTSENGVEGSKKFEYLIIPRHAGNFTIPSYSFTYFNPISKRYVTESTPEYEIKVDRGENESGDVSVSTRSVSKKDVALIGSDIRYIKTNTIQLKENRTFFFGSFVFWLLLSLPLIGLFILIAIRKKIQESANDVVGNKQRKARKMAEKHLAKAKQFLDDNQKSEFYEQIFKSIYGFLSDKFAIPVSELNQSRIRTELQNRNVSESVIEETLALLKNCEMARYAPLTDISEETVYENANALIQKIEGGLS